MFVLTYLVWVDKLVLINKYSQDLELKQIEIREFNQEIEKIEIEEFIQEIENTI